MYTVPPMITHLEGAVLVHPIVMNEGDTELAMASLPLRDMQRVITRASHDAIMHTNLARFSEYH